MWVQKHHRVTGVLQKEEEMWARVAPIGARDPTWGTRAGEGSGNGGLRELTAECLCWTERKEGLAGGRFWVNHGAGQGPGVPREGQEGPWADSAGEYDRPSGAATCPGAYLRVCQDNEG